MCLLEFLNAKQTKMKTKYTDRDKVWNGLDIDKDGQL